MIRAAHFVELGDGCNDVHKEEDEVQKVPLKTHLRVGVQAKENVSAKIDQPNTTVVVRITSFGPWVCL
jgi:hypothetical protein